jgi:hypothetical protein
MLQLRGCLYLGEKSFCPERCREVWMKNLDGDIALVAKIVSEINCRHAAGADFAVESVFGVKRVCKAG